MPDRSIDFTRQLDATPSEVFRAWTDAQQLSRWWTTSAESDARTGGEFSFVFEFEDASHDHIYAGRYHDVTPDERVSFPWQGTSRLSRVDVRLRPRGSGTELALTHSGLGEGAEADEAITYLEPGWNFFLDNLVAYLDRGEDLRPSAPMGQKTPATV